MPPSAATSQYPPPSGVAAMPTMGELSWPLSDPWSWAEPKAATVPFASASQYPVPLVQRRDARPCAMTTRPRPTPGPKSSSHRRAARTSSRRWRRWNRPRSPMASRPPPWRGPAGRSGSSANWCRMMSRWPQHPDGVRRLQAALVVDDAAPAVVVHPVVVGLEDRRETAGPDGAAEGDRVHHRSPRSGRSGRCPSSLRPGRTR